MSTDKSDSLDDLSFSDRCKIFLKAFPLRFLVHCCAIVAASAMINALAPAETSKSDLILGAYIGLVCLFPRGIGLNARWLIPTAVGLSQCLLWIMLGMPWQLTLVSGGAQTWIQRLISHKGKLGWEWTAFPWLMAALFDVVKDNGPPEYISGFPYWTFLLVILAGWVVQKACEGANLHPLKVSHKFLQDTLAAESLPVSLQAPIQQLVLHTQQAMNFDYSLKVELQNSAANRIWNVTEELKRLDKNSQSPSRYKQIGDLASMISSLNDTLAQELEVIAPKVSQKPASTQSPTARKNLQEKAAEMPPAGDLAARLDWYQKSVTRLAEKIQYLPQHLHTHLQGICRTTEKILTCMRTDPADVVAGDKFLVRYLAAAHTVVDEYKRLSAEGTGYQNVEPVLQKSGELLQRLEAAFAAEHTTLLQNDTRDFAVELDVLDQMLKMEGR